MASVAETMTTGEADGMADAALDEVVDELFALFAERLTSDEAIEALARAAVGRDAERWHVAGATERLTSIDDLTPQARADRCDAARHDLEAVAAALLPGREDGQTHG